MTSVRNRIRIGLVSAGALMLAPGCKPKVNEYKPPPPAEVTVATPVEQEVTEYINYTGVLEPFQTVELRARVSGFLEKINFKPGAIVKKGDVLFVIDKRTFVANVDQAKAQLASAKSQLESAEADAKLAEDLAAQRAGSDIDRITKIAKRDGVRAQVAGAQAALATAQLDLDFCDVVAPIDGRITRNVVDVGNLVGKGDATLLATIVSNTPVYVNIESNEADLLRFRRQGIAKINQGKIEPGMTSDGQWREVELAIGDEAGFVHKGNVDYVDPRLNPDTATIRVRARFENEGNFLLPGMFCRVRIPIEKKNAMLVRDIALGSDQGGRYALVVDSSNKVELRRVKIGALFEGLRVVESGLTTSDKVVINGLQRARPGATVAPKVGPMQATAPPPAKPAAPANDAEKKPDQK